MAPAGPDGKKVAGLLRTSIKQGTAVLGEIAHAAVKRLLADPARAKRARRLFTDAERQELADVLAATNATAELLGRARVARRQQQSREHHEAFAEAISFSDTPTDLVIFEERPLHPLAPKDAYDYFRSLIPIPGIDDPGQWGDDLHRVAFTLAASTEETLLARVQDIIAEALRTGHVSDSPKAIDDVLDQAGVSPRNPQRAEMIFRTNMMEALNHGAHAAMQDPDVADDFPVWRYIGIEDGRERPNHKAQMGRYFPNSTSFAEVRDRIKGSFDGWNCRCTSQPIFRSDWKRLQEQGAAVERFAEQLERFDEGDPDALLAVPDVPQQASYDCGAAAAMAVGRFFGVGPESLGEWRKLLGTDPDDGTPPEAVVRVLTGLGLRAEPRHLMTLDDLRQAWRGGSPVICPIQDYGPDAGPGDYDDGHYIVVVGVGLGMVFVQDSMADAELEGSNSDAAAGKVMIPRERFLEVWHDKGAGGRYYVRFGVVVSRRDR